MGSYFQEGGEKASTQGKQILAAMATQFPQLAGLYGDALSPAALDQLAANLAFSEPQAQLQADIYKNQGQQMADVGREQLRRDALGAAQTELDIARGSGSQLADIAMGLQRQEDAPFYDTRDLVAKGMADWFAGQNPNGLSGSERAEMEKTGARSIGYNPSTMNAVANAANTGEALANKQSRFADNVAKMSSALPTLKSGLDMTRVATSRQSQANPGTQFFQGAKDDAGQWITGPLNSWTSGLQDTSRQQNSQQKSAATNTAQTVGTVASLVGAFCWVARAAYGEHDNRWKDFANWLSIDAPDWLYNLYISAGEQFAEFVKLHKPVQSFLRFWMNKVI